jgi:hypothetical protein
MASFAVTRWKPESAAAKSLVRQQLNRILAHPAFKNSRRCPSLLSHVVERTLEGHADALKERALGIEVFARPFDYDTSLDPVVRTTANEVRKRIAQYYHEPGHEQELRIDLPAGSYVPEFHLAQENSAVPPPLALPQLSSTPAEVQTADSGPNSRTRWRWVFLLTAAVLALSSAAVLGWWSSRAAVNRFWNPVLSTAGPILVSVGEPRLGLRRDSSSEGGDMSVGDHAVRGDAVALSDAISSARIAAFLSDAGKPFHMQSAAETTLTDLRQGSAVLVAGFDNPWTLRLTDPLRFHFSTDGKRFCWIEDRENPAQKSWFVDFAAPYSKLSQDFALVARFLDTDSGQIVVVAAGIGENGTLAAGELLTDRKYLSSVRSPKPGALERGNVEFVLATQVIDGKSGPPRILAEHSW